ncbi:MAG: hypothetical protein JO013_10000 [Alphaproteobacteria bacterium]|nr:hypothetical protein [Alphaproteobacteria bacterium]
MPDITPDAVSIDSEPVTSRAPSLFERMAEAARSGQVHAVLAADAAARRAAAPDRLRVA